MRWAAWTRRRGRRLHRFPYRLGLATRLFLRGIALLRDRGLPLTLKTVAVTVNKHEVWDMQRFAEDELGVPFRFDAMMNPRIDCLLRDAAHLEVIVTDSVVEALALENHLIKQRNPRYNVLLRDDKTYPYLQLTLTERAPRLLVARRVERDGNAYAGPFMPASLARRTMTLAQRLFGIRSCNEVIDGQRDRPCLEYDIKRCIAPCVESVCSAAQYDAAVAQARLLMDGKQEELVGQLHGQMMQATDIMQ